MFGIVPVSGDESYLPPVPNDGRIRPDAAASVADSHRRVDGYHQEALSATALAGARLGTATGATDRAAVVSAALELTKADFGLARGPPSRPCGEVR